MDLPKGDVTPYAYLFSKMGDKGEGRGQKYQKMGDIIYGRMSPKPLYDFIIIKLTIYHLY